MFEFAIPYSLTLDLVEWSDSGSGRFISDVPCTEVLRSLDITALFNNKLLKKDSELQNRKTKESKRKNCLTS